MTVAALQQFWSGPPYLKFEYGPALIQSGALSPSLFQTTAPSRIVSTHRNLRSKLRIFESDLKFVHASIHPADET